VGYDFYKRLGVLKRQTDEGLIGRIGFFRAFFVSLLPLWLLAFILAKLFPSDVQLRLDSELLNQARIPQAQSARRDLDRLETDDLLDRLDKQQAPAEADLFEKKQVSLNWHQEMRLLVKERLDWLDNSLFVAPYAGDSYLAFAQLAVNSLVGKELQATDVPHSNLVISGWIDSLVQAIVSGFLRLGFVLIAFWPLWIAGVLAGYFGARPLVKPRATVDFLGVCDRGQGPFYSGLYVPLKPNEGISGTDLSVPGLATPAKKTPAEARQHPLAGILKRFNATSETNLELTAIIAAYGDYPSFVEDERCADDATDPLPEMLADGEDEVAPVSASGGSGIIHNPSITVERAAREGLLAVLEAHAAVRAYVEARGDNLRGSESDETFAQHLKLMSESANAAKTPLGARLLKSLTPNRARAIAVLKPQVVATAYLATEAGKSLVFKRVGKGFSQISRYPHLQARAVLHSVVAYHRDFDGDTRLTIRQAILCSRRHGDFGRSFLPVNMPIASRALRDWLEISYASPEKLAETSHLVELDAHLEEIHNGFRYEFYNRLRNEQKGADISSLSGAGLGKFWKGALLKSVVIVPLESVITMGLQAISPLRQNRITKLIDRTRHLQAQISISARLPGFKRQAEEAEFGLGESDGIAQRLALRQGGAELVEKWLIVRRVLTKYNWLATRVGDDGVPLDGLLQAVIVDRHTGGRPVVQGFEAMAPLRQRRFKDLSGSDWERTFYRESPYGSDIQIFVDNAYYQETLAIRQREAREGKLAPPADESTAPPTAVTA